METTVYLCGTCGLRVHPGEGYIHTTREAGSYWRVDHRHCYDMTGEYCVAVPHHWIEFLTAHRDLAARRAERQVPA
jgi:hypothetical protein